MRLFSILVVLIITAVNAGAAPVTKPYTPTATPFQPAAILDDHRRYLMQFGDVTGISPAFSGVTEMLANGRLSEAKGELAHLRMRYRDSPGILELQGLIQLLEGHPAEAEQTLLRALDANDDIPSLWTKLASARLAQQRVEEGREALEKAIALDPDNVLAHHLLGRIALVGGNPAVAESHYRSALSRIEGFSPMHAELARLLLAEKQPQAAVALLAQVAETAPTPQAWPLLVSAYFQSGDRQRALSAIGASVQRFPGDKGLLLALIESLREQGETAEAIRLATDGLQRFHNHAPLNFQLANLYQANGEYAAAERIYRQLLGDRHGRLLALNNLAVMLSERPGRENDAVVFARTAHSAAPQIAAIQDTLGWALFRSGNAREALEYLRSATDDNPEGEHLCHLAIASAEVEGLQRARQRLQHCMAIDNGKLARLAATYLQPD